MLKTNLKYLVVAFGIISCKGGYDFLENTKKIGLPIHTQKLEQKTVQSLSKREIKKMQLGKIFSPSEIQAKNNQYTLLFQPLLSNTYDSFVIHAAIENSQETSILANYTKTHQLIDYKVVHYEERLDAIIKTVSSIYKDSLISKEYNLYSNEKPTILRYQITENGNIIRN